ncbi:uncharacterized protein LOC126894734 [Daktulosphaira vitifoliae]|uniref:uncharacterized protein LOC126894734 n=1 Tax=Daktulosphaira vitifoliae TaxID=58002 RepID=UPI0021A9BC5E|nr:uncharacterized protein LOC126894734 [Daktulosphaira vitifoliae]XP_050521913.1 uncharacterized protein LOC126894734 [Daktulosphaira vitifoliae]
MHKWLQLPATPTDDPLATVYPINHYKKSHVYAVTRINPIYVDDEHHGTWDKSRVSSGYESQPQSDHSSSLEKSSPPPMQYPKSNGSPPCSSRSSSDKSSQKLMAPWLSPIKEGVVDIHEYCIPRPVWPGYDDIHRYPDPERIPRARCCRHCIRCKYHGTSGGSSNNSGYSSAYSGSISTRSSSFDSRHPNSGSGGEGTGSLVDEASPSSGTVSVKSNTPSPQLNSRYFLDDGKPQVNNWNSIIDLRLNQKTENLPYDCGAVLRGLQFTLDPQQAEKLMQKMKVGKKQRCWCRVITALLGLIMFLVSVVTVSLALSRGQKMFGSL